MFLSDIFILIEAQPVVTVLRCQLLYQTRNIFRIYLFDASQSAFFWLSLYFQLTAKLTLLLSFLVLLIVN